MFQLKLEVTGEIGLYRKGMREIKKIPRKEMNARIFQQRIPRRCREDDVFHTYWQDNNIKRKRNRTIYICF